ncbi:MAG: ABC transporter substrate-binding protein [Colwellia sp.]
MKMTLLSFFDKNKIFFCLVVLFIFSWPISAQQRYRIYIDADFSSTQASSNAIKRGIEVALAEENFQIGSFTFELVTKDHHGNSLRSKRNLETFVSDPQGLVVFSGLHSPPLLANKEFINRNNILMLVPWAAAGPITRSGDDENWIFRLSIDDSNAGTFITEQALKEGFKKPLLLLENTGWGRSNERTMTQALQQKNIKLSNIKWFNWGLGINHAKLLLREAMLDDSDVIFFVGNANEGKVFIKAMAELESDKRLPIRSHWGITGGNFAEAISAKQRENIDLQFIQTRFSFLTQPKTVLAKQVFKQTTSRYSMIKRPSDIKAQTGFIHAYDLTKILIAAIKSASLNGNREHDSQAIKVALENLQKPVEGLIKTYDKPFSQYTANDVNAHEALSIADYVMAYYNDNNNIVLLKK